VLLHDVVGDREPETRPLADGLGGEEGVEDPVENLGIDAAAIVFDVQERLVVATRNADREVTASIVLKLERAIEQARANGIEYRSCLVGGGVSANSRLRSDLSALADRQGLDLRLPAMGYCLDNAAMIAGLGHPLLEAGLRAGLDLRAQPTTAC